jgi:hypothetical protein
VVRIVVARTGFVVVRGLLMRKLLRTRATKAPAVIKSTSAQIKFTRC